MVSILLGVWNGGGVCCCCPAQCSGAAHTLLVPLQCWRVLLSCRALFLAGCVVCGWWVCVCAVRVVGYPLCAPPRRGWWAGPLQKGGVCAAMVGGMVGEGRLCCWPPPSCVWCPRLCVGAPPCRSPLWPIEWRGGVCVMPCLRIGSGTLHCAAPLHIVCSPRIVPVPLLSCVVVFVGGGEVRCVGLCLALLFCLCVRCHSIVGLVLCLCDRVMSLWNSGGGLCG